MFHARKSFRFIALSFAFLFVLAFSSSALSQNVTVNPNTMTYPTVSAAFAAINNGVHTGAVTVEIVADTTEPTTAAASAVLNASGGTANYTSVLITPSGGAPRTVSGAAAAGFALIELNGADNVTFDGLNDGANSLTISNTNASAISGTSTIRFVADATGNTINRTTVLGSFSGSAFTNGGTIFFSTAVTGGTGNDTNTISNSNLGPAGTNLPTKAIYSSGTTTAVGNYNSGNIITANNIFDFFGAAVTSAGIYMGGGTTDWTISGNRLYQTAIRTQTIGAIHAGIQVASTNVNNTTVSGNIIGYASNTQTGTYNFVGISSSSKFLPIYFSSAGTTTASSVQGNTITAINMSGTLGGTGTTAAFNGISIGSGLVNIGNVTGNTVGSLTTPGAITISYAGTASSDIRGIYFFPSQAANVLNNNVGGFAITNSATGIINTSFFGIHAFTTSTVTNTMQNNTVGSAAAPISVSSAATGSRVIGLYSQSGIPAVSGNIIRNLTTDAPNVGTGTSASVIGLQIQATSTTLSGGSVARNTIHSLSNTNATAAVTVSGILYTGQTTATNIVERNFVHSLGISTSAAGVLRGIDITAGTTQFQNNMIRLGVDAAGVSVTGGYDIVGINETVGTDNIYFNSVYIGGSSGTTAVNSFAFNSAVTTNTRNYINNIFANNRSLAGGGGVNAAAQYSGTLPAAGLTSNYNIYFSQDPNTAIRNNAVDYTLAAWQTSGQDANSLQATSMAQIGFVNPDGDAATADLHITPGSIAIDEGTPINAFAGKSSEFSLAPVTNDFDGQARPNGPAPDIGADELVAPTAAQATLTGRVTTAGGNGIRGAVVSISGGDLPQTRFARTGSFGYYSFDELSVGETYILTINSKRYTFTVPTRVIQVNDNIDGVDFVAEQ